MYIYILYSYRDDIADRRLETTTGLTCHGTKHHDTAIFLGGKNYKTRCNMWVNTCKPSMGFNGIYNDLMGFNRDSMGYCHGIYPLVNIQKATWKMATEVVEYPLKNGDFHSYVAIYQRVKRIAWG